MNSFGISIFEEPQQFVALYLGMKTYPELFARQIERLIHRTKSPPLAVTYTYHFLKDKSQEELSLDVIRFVSQLADLSPGVSMASSLQGILTESTFLTELRHNLTHKNMVKGSILTLARKLILQELYQKYWQATCQKLTSTYRLNHNKILQYYNQIYQCQYTEDLSWISEQQSLQFYQQCSNYEYKEHILTIIDNFKAGGISSQQMCRYYKQVNSAKQAIFVTLVLQDYLEGEREIEHFTNFTIKIAEELSQQLFNQQFIRRQLLKAYFIKYLDRAANLLQILPPKYQRDIELFWKQKEAQVGKLY